MTRIPKSADEGMLTALGLQQGSLRKWKYWAKPDFDINVAIDRLAVISQTSTAMREKQAGDYSVTLPISSELTGIVYMSTLKAGLNPFSRLFPSPLRRMLSGAVILNSIDLPAAQPLAYVRRGGVFSTLDELLIVRKNDGYVPLSELVVTLSGAPDPACQVIWSKMGDLFGEIHSRKVIAGIEKASQVLVRMDGNDAKLCLVAGRNFHVNPVIGFLREFEDLVGANFVFSPAIAPLDRIRFLDAYAAKMGWSRAVLRSNLDLLSDLIRLRAAREWKVFTSNIPKKTTLLNLIRALD
ncbi:MAG: hypothetical protein WC712_10360, partial [Candidatus Brocadiia bacterium]